MAVASGSHAAVSEIAGGERKAESQEESEYNVPKHSVRQADATSSLSHQVLENSAVKPDLQLTDETCEKNEDDSLYANNTQIASQVLKFANNKFKRDSAKTFSFLSCTNVLLERILKIFDNINNFIILWLENLKNFLWL